MKFFTRLKEKFRNIINVYKQIKTDDEYYKEYIRGMRAEAQNIDSEFAKYDLKISDDGKFITHLLRLPEQFISASDYMIYEKLNESSYFITEYLRNNLGLGMYVSIPEYYHVEDPTTPDVDSTTYLTQWTFQPVIEPEMKHRYMNNLYVSITGILLLIVAFATYLIIF